MAIDTPCVKNASCVVLLLVVLCIATKTITIEGHCKYYEKPQTRGEGCQVGFSHAKTHRVIYINRHASIKREMPTR